VPKEAVKKALPEAMITATELTKKYGDFVAVDGVNFTVRRGESFGLLGPNGAGKSTTMKMIAATSQRTGGDLVILGKDPNTQGPEIRAHLGVVPQQDNLDRELKVWENLMVYGRYFGLSRKWLKGKIEELLEFAQLVEKRNNKTEELSGGMKRRLTIARGLINEPEILLLDEPTAALGVQESKSVLEVIERFRSQNQMSLLIISHNLEHVWQVCDRILVLRGGNLVANLVKNDVTKSDVVSHITGAYSK